MVLYVYVDVSLAFYSDMTPAASGEERDLGIPQSLRLQCMDMKVNYFGNFHPFHRKIEIKKEYDLPPPKK